MSEGIAQLGAHSGGDRALDEGRIDEDEMLWIVGEIEHGFHRHRRRSEIGEDDDAVALICADGSSAASTAASIFS